MKPKLPSGVKIIIERLESHGKRGHIVGGCVRDFLLSKEPYDYDITTDALPNEMAEIFSDMKTVETGIKHGTLTVLCDGLPYEVTTYRVDGEYEDRRRPSSVSFTASLSEDLARRDFTMNAVCYSERDGFIDKFFGIEDINKRVIRAVGEPAKRFSEDALRILRAIRFASVLGFEIEEKTAKAARDAASLLKSVSAERIYSEWKKLIGGADAYNVISNYGDILSVFLFNEPIILPKRELFEKASSEARLLSVFKLSHKNPAERFADFCMRMKTDSKTKKLGILALENINSDLTSLQNMRLLIIKCGIEAAELICELKELLGEDCAVKSSRISELLESGYPLSLSELKVGGDDIKALGFHGKEIGELLSRLLSLTACGKVKNEREALLSAAQRLK